MLLRQLNITIKLVEPGNAENAFNITLIKSR